MSHNHLFGPSGFAKARSSSSKEEANILIVENRPYIPSLLVDTNDYETSVIHVAKVILSHHAAAAGEIIDTSTIMSSTTTNKVTVISGGLTNADFYVNIHTTKSFEANGNAGPLGLIRGQLHLMEESRPTGGEGSQREWTSTSRGMKSALRGGY